MFFSQRQQKRKIQWIAVYRSITLKPQAHCVLESLNWIIELKWPKKHSAIVKLDIIEM